MEIAIVAARVLLGLCMVLVSVLAIFKRELMPAMPEKGQALMNAFRSSGYMYYLIYVTQLMMGILLLTGLFVPLAIIILLPISLNILLFHIFLSPPAGPGLFVFLLNMFLLWVYRAHYFSLLQL